ncbi:hypothetical protein C1M51_02955 [Methylibium sp. Pch-M]|uniref:hypothetical protein n=1 Tax=Methylibium sp. Pch-M TaxID=2082386 RepID=UPI001010140E|nr:hypothetical protein [Methylibium sp. Pch-M]QAZ38464.1 hypothetical protein C1M51_02955 [Methylibium sp. Pch-M]
MSDDFREAALALIEKLDAAEPHIDAMCAMAHNRGTPYKGPTYGVELEALRAALATPPEAPKPAALPEDLADALREVGKWLNEEPNRPVDRAAVAKLCAALQAKPAAQAVPDLSKVPFLIYFDDYDRRPGVVVGEAAAREVFRQISVNWNAHLFVKIASNTRDDRYARHNATLAASPPAPAQPEALMPCGHPASLMLHSAETREPLYCESCDDKSGRADAERRESDLAEANGALRAEIERLKAQHADDACCKCGTKLAAGIATGQTFDCSDEGTCSPAGPGVIVPCMKCPACGWSRTATAADVATTLPERDEPAQEIVAWWYADGDVKVRTSRTPPVTTALYAGPVAAQHAEDARDATGRSAQDYAIEHAEYMAASGEHLIAAVNDLARASLEAEDGIANPSDVDAARATVDEAMRGLRDGIHEFRKRRDRAASAPAQHAEDARDAARAELVKDLLASAQHTEENAGTLLKFGVEMEYEARCRCLVAVSLRSIANMYEFHASVAPLLRDLAASKKGGAA